MKTILLLAVYFTLPLANASPFGQLEYNEKICGALEYSQGSYVLRADHGDSYTVRESKFDQQDMYLTKQMQIIVMNHDYNETSSPQACFFGLGSERVGTSDLDVLTLENVRLRETVN